MQEIEEQTPSGNSLRAAYRRRSIQVLSTLAISIGLLFLGAGTFSWVWPWAYLAFALAGLIVNFLVFPPALVAARSRTHTDVPNWERNVTRAAIPLWLLLFGLAGWDHRVQFTPTQPLFVHLLALAPMSLGSALLTWAMVSNRYFATQVRIQTERGHTVESRGPYRFLRHPGYLGMLLSYLALPFFLGAWLALAPALCFTALFVVRTALEDRFLRTNLPGYAEYAERVRARLVPFVW